MTETFTGNQTRTAARDLGQITMPYDAIKREAMTPNAEQGAESATVGEAGKKKPNTAKEA